jgi:Ca2+-binding RTX toxin-like protein
MSFIDGFAHKTSWKTLIDAAIGAVAGYEGKPPQGYHDVNLEGLVPDENSNGAFFVAKGGAARLMESGNGTYMLSFRGTDINELLDYDKTDVREWAKVIADEYLKEFRALFDAIRHLPGGASLIVTGHSLGGWLANKYAEAYKGMNSIWGHASYYGFESPFISGDANNFGFANDFVYKLLEDGKGAVPEVYVNDTGVNEFFFQHNKSSVVEALEMLRDYSFSDYAGFEDMFIVNVEHAELTRCIAYAVTNGKEIKAVDAHYLGNTLDEFVSLNLHVRGIRFSDLRKGNDRLDATLDVKDNVIGSAGNDIIGAGLGDDKLSGDELYTEWTAGHLNIASSLPAISVGGASLNLQRELRVLQARDGALKHGAAVTGNDSLNGGGGNDLIFGGSGFDTLIGGENDDVLLGGRGNDSIDGGKGDDLLGGGSGTDTLIGGTDNDIYLVDQIGDHVNELKNAGIDTVILAAFGKFKADNIEIVALTSDVTSVTINGTSAGTQTAATNANLLIGGNDSNNAIAVSFNDTSVVVAAYGGAGNDNLQGGLERDWFYGDSGNDTANGGQNDDTLYGGVGNDTLVGSDGDDILSGDANKDSLEGGRGDDRLNGGKEGDTLKGSKGDDRLSGDAGADTLDGGKGDDHFLGGDDVDHLKGGDGWDVLDGGAGVDFMDGGKGSDTYISHGSLDNIGETKNRAGSYDVLYFDAAEINLNKFVRIDGFKMDGQSAVSAGIDIDTWSADASYYPSFTFGAGGGRLDVTYSNTSELYHRETDVFCDDGAEIISVHYNSFGQNNEQFHDFGQAIFNFDKSKDKLEISGLNPELIFATASEFDEWIENDSHTAGKLYTVLSLDDSDNDFQAVDYSIVKFGPIDPIEHEQDVETMTSFEVASFDGATVSGSGMSWFVT